jgi:hypothetical protein
MLHVPIDDNNFAKNVDRHCKRECGFLNTIPKGIPVRVVSNAVFNVYVLRFFA